MRSRTLVIFLMSIAVEATAQPIHGEEPRTGRLGLGQVVLVDDGSCPKGQIKELTGGNNMNYDRWKSDGGGTKGMIARHRRCIPRR